MYPKDPRPRLDPLASYLYAVKQMQHLPMFIGSVVHKVIENALKDRQKTGRGFDLAKMEKSGQQLLKKGIEDSEKELWKKSPKHRANLFEIYYSRRGSEEGLDPAAVQAGEEKVLRCLKNWVESPIVNNLILSDQSRIVSIESLDSFKVKNLFKVYVVVDFAMRWRLHSGDEVLVLFDWKTGKETDKTIDQLYSYALYAKEVWEQPYDRLILSPVYLDSGNYEKIGFKQDQPISEPKVAETEAFIENSSLAMLESVAGANLEEKLQSNKLRAQDCAYTEKRYHCRRCPFRELCEGVAYENVDEGELRAKAAQLAEV